MTENMTRLFIYAHFTRLFSYVVWVQVPLWVPQYCHIAQLAEQDKYARVGEKEYFCKDCGKQITKYSTSGLCQDCSKKNRRTVERPNREELKQLIRSNPFTYVANMFDVSDNTIRKWCKAENLPSKVSEIKAYSDEEWASI